MMDIEYFGHAFAFQFFSLTGRESETYAVTRENEVGVMYSMPFRICYFCVIRQKLGELNLPAYQLIPWRVNP